VGGVITVRYFAGARAAAGVSEESVPRDEAFPPGATLGDLVTWLTARHGARLGAVLGAASFLVDGVVCRNHYRALPDAVVVDVLPPFAGG
jgi:sulfur-carrier protein